MPTKDNKNKNLFGIISTLTFLSLFLFGIIFENVDGKIYKILNK